MTFSHPSSTREHSATRSDDILTKKSITPSIALTMIDKDYDSTATVENLMVVIGNDSLGIPLYCPSGWKNDNCDVRRYTIDDGLSERNDLKGPQLPTTTCDQPETTEYNHVVFKDGASVNGTFGLATEGDHHHRASFNTITGPGAVPAGGQSYITKYSGDVDVDVRDSEGVHQTVCQTSYLMELPWCHFFFW
jgi:hypothetical protein